MLRRAGVYKELVNYVQFKYGLGDVGDCYFIDDPLCPEPLAVDEFFRNTLGDRWRRHRPGDSTSQSASRGNRVTGVVVDGIEYTAAVVIDATEFSDLYPLVDGLDYEVGDPAGCVQDTTWLAIRSWYPNGRPRPNGAPQDAIAQIYSVYGSESDRWLDHFRANGGRERRPARWQRADGLPLGRGDRDCISGPGRQPRGNPLMPRSPITRTGVNYANDSSLTVAAIEDPVGPRAGIPQGASHHLCVPLVPPLGTRRHRLGVVERHAVLEGHEDALGRPHS